MRRTIAVIALSLLVNIPFAREGMWIPLQITGKLAAEMKDMGMQFPPSDIYSDSLPAMNDAVVHFGGGCTGEMISSRGLLITNHHCGYSRIQALSTIANNYLKNGFWAAEEKDELPCRGLTATFIREIHEITEGVFNGLPDGVSGKERTALIRQRTDSIEKIFADRDTTKKVFSRGFYHNNRYFLFVTEVFRDLRLVGAPPESVGKFGGETDNWVWPRHTGDFSMFRIYASKDNRPADYSEENIPYTPEKYFRVSTEGVKDGDFTMVFGFPGTTKYYIPSSSLDIIANQTNPNRITIRDARLNIWRSEMAVNDTVELHYAAKFATLSNAWKKWRGELIGLKRFDVMEKKRAFETGLRRKFNTDPSLQKYRTLPSRYDSLNALLKPVSYANDFVVEALIQPEIFSLALKFRPLADKVSKQSSDAELEGAVHSLAAELRNFYASYHPRIDMRMTAAMLALCDDSLKAGFRPDILDKTGAKYKGRWEAYASDLFSESMLDDSARILSFLDDFNAKKMKRITSDPVYRLAVEFAAFYQEVHSAFSELNSAANEMQREYMEALMAAGEENLFPDANGTLRVSFGKVHGVEPRDGMRYDFYTTASGIAEKAALGNPEYEVPEKLLQLIRKKDYGNYASDGELPVAFLSSNHTTGGNSGSPVLNAKGELIGLNYDRMWEGVMSDMYFDQEICRNISVDIRYVLFIIDRFAGAHRLIKEMGIEPGTP